MIYIGYRNDVQAGVMGGGLYPIQKFKPRPSPTQVGSNKQDIKDKKKKGV